MTELYKSFSFSFYCILMIQKQISEPPRLFARRSAEGSVICRWAQFISFEIRNAFKLCYTTIVKCSNSKHFMPFEFELFLSVFFVIFANNRLHTLSENKIKKRLSFQMRCPAKKYAKILFYEDKGRICY